MKISPPVDIVDRTENTGNDLNGNQIDESGVPSVDGDASAKSKCSDVNSSGIDS